MGPVTSAVVAVGPVKQMCWTPTSCVADAADSAVKSIVKAFGEADRKSVV